MENGNFDAIHRLNRPRTNESLIRTASGALKCVPFQILESSPPAACGQSFSNWLALPVRRRLSKMITKAIFLPRTASSDIKNDLRGCSPAPNLSVRSRRKGLLKKRWVASVPCTPVHRRPPLGMPVLVRGGLLGVWPLFVRAGLIRQLDSA